MYNLNKKEKLDFVLKNQKELKISANTISKNTKLTEAGIQRILNGTSKNPQENSLNEIIAFFEKRILGIDDNKIEEPAAVYTDPNLDLTKYVNCIERESKLLKEIHKLQSLLRKNKIEFKDFFEDEE
jgi:hypothetical protein